MSEIAELSVRALAEAIRARRVSPVEAPELNAFITVVGEQALAQARQAKRGVTEGRALGPLHGVPFSVKDLTNTSGVRTTMGSRLFADNVPAVPAVGS